MEKFFGKYRGKVTNNIDPMQLGRIQVSVPSVLGDGRLNWAMPCVQYAGPQVGLFAIPPVNANVWVEFEGGSLDYPIWSGCFWGTGELPPPALTGEKVKVFKTDSITLALSDVPGAGGVKLEVDSPGVSKPLKMEFASSGITIDCAPANIKLSSESIEMELPSSKIKLDSKQIEAASGASSVKIAAQNIEAASPPSSLKIGSSGVEATNGPAALKLEGPKVDVNKGALEVI